MEHQLSIHNLHARIDQKEILKGVTLTIRAGEVHAIMGPNGSGKSTLAQTLAGHPRYECTQGTVHMNGEDISAVPPDERARKGLFLAFQYPLEVSGVPLATFLRHAYIARTGEQISVPKFRALLKSTATALMLPESFLDRSLNEGFSGGEKKKCEILQMAILKPSFAILDETDSGLDIDALRTVAHGVNTLMDAHLGVLIITHYQRILQYITPHHVHVMVEGRIVESGGEELAKRLEKEGYGIFGKSQ